MVLASFPPEEKLAGIAPAKTEENSVLSIMHDSYIIRFAMSELWRAIGTAR